MRTNGTRLTPGQGWVLALTSAASLMVSLDVQVVATALPVIRLHLHASLAALEWTVNAYTLSFAVLLLTGAALGERLGRRRMLADEAERARASLDPAGLLLAAGAALGIVWALIRADGLVIPGRAPAPATEPVPVPSHAPKIEIRR